MYTFKAKNYASYCTTLAFKFGEFLQAFTQNKVILHELVIVHSVPSAFEIGKGFCCFYIEIINRQSKTKKHKNGSTSLIDELLLKSVSNDKSHCDTHFLPKQLNGIAVLLLHYRCQLF